MLEKSPRLVPVTIRPLTLAAGRVHKDSWAKCEITLMTPSRALTTLVPNTGLVGLDSSGKCLTPNYPQKGTI